MVTVRELLASMIEKINSKVRTVNGIEPDRNGNVEIDIPDSTVDVELDTTLSQSGKAADAKAVGDALANIEVGGVSSWNDLTDKPFYEEGGIEVILDNQSVTGSIIDGISTMHYTMNFGLNLVIGETYTANINGVEFTSTAFESDEDQGAVCIGNPYLFTSPIHPDGEGFALMTSMEANITAFVLRDEGTETATISIYKDSTVVHTLDDKFIPSEIARVSYVEEALPSAKEVTIFDGEITIYDHVLIDTLVDVTTITSRKIDVEWDGVKYSLDTFFMSPTDGRDVHLAGNMWYAFERMRFFNPAPSGYPGNAKCPFFIYWGYFNDTETYMSIVIANENPVEETHNVKITCHIPNMVFDDELIPNSVCHDEPTFYVTAREEDFVEDESSTETKRVGAITLDTEYAVIANAYLSGRSVAVRYCQTGSEIVQILPLAIAYPERNAYCFMGTFIGDTKLITVNITTGYSSDSDPYKASIDMELNTIASTSDITEGFSGSWNDLTDKPFYEESNQTVIEWDGNTEDRESVDIYSFGTFYKVSELTPTRDELLGATMGALDPDNDYAYSEQVITEDVLSLSSNFTPVNCLIVGAVIVAYNTNISIDYTEYTLPSTGVWAATALRLLTYNTTTIHTLDEKFIPDNARADWEQNDSTAKDYVKNRTHYKQVESEVEIISDYFDNPEYAGGIYYGPLELTNAPILGETYKVSMPNNAIYSVECELKQYSTYMWYLGNLTVAPYNFYTGEDTGESFLIEFAVSNGQFKEGTKAVIYTRNYDSSYSQIVNIVGPSVVYYPLNQKYLPDNVNKFISKSYVQSINGYAPNSNGDIWMAPYKTTEKEVIIVEGLYDSTDTGRVYVSGSANYTVYETHITDVEPVELVIGETYVTSGSGIDPVNGSIRSFRSNPLTLKISSEGCLYAGNPTVAGLPDETEDPYNGNCIVFYHTNNVVTSVKYYCTSWRLNYDKYKISNFKITGPRMKYVQLDEKLIPDTIARTSDIPEISDAVIAPTTAQVGQTIVVKSVDENGKPTEWEAADMPDITGKMDAENPVGTGSFSMNRKAGTVVGTCSHAEGYNTTAFNGYSHAEGMETAAFGFCSHTEGYYTIASHDLQHVQGKYNIPELDGPALKEGKYAHIVGNGSSDDSRSNAYTLDWNGIAWYQGRPQFGGNAQDDGSQTVMANGDSEIFLTSANGTKFRITVGDDGTLSATAV